VGSGPGLSTGWISADFGGIDQADRLVIGSGYGGKSVIATHKYNLTDWGGALLLNPLGGNVGIGTANPSQKLAVNGTILAKKVKVSQSAADWPDYVFDSSYSLPSLDSVSTFIQANKHLPDIPSAATVEKDGHDLGEVQKQLLKKVEELTLYVIELKKNDEAQKKENELLRKEMELLKKRK
jgi:GTPase involved in cell partitioning and DNA repair